jgi:peptidoglycan hydrolase CwlO-like protein
MTKPITPSPLFTLRAVGIAILTTIAVAVSHPDPAMAGHLSHQLSAKRSQFHAERARQLALSSALEHYSSEISRIEDQVAALRAREAAVRRQLVEVRAELAKARAHLERVRSRLHRAMGILKERLVAAYESDRPDVMTVILKSHGFDQLTSRYASIQALEHQDASIVQRTRRLRDQVHATVVRVREARDSLAAKRDELARTESELEARQSALATARDQKQKLLATVRANSAQLQRDISDLQGRIDAARARRAAAAAAAQSSSIPSPSFSAELGPIPPGQAISPFPASVPVTWGRTDQGIDGTTTPGAPLLAMGSGTVTIGHDPAGFGDSYPILHTSFGDFYYGHCVPSVGDGAQVSIGQPIATAHTGTWGNSTTPGGFEIGAWPPGDMAAGAAIRDWLIGLPRR